MKKYLSVLVIGLLVITLLPSMAFAGEKEVLTALENIRKALDTGVPEPVNETLDKLVSEAKAAIEANEKAGGGDEQFTVNARKSLDYFERIVQMIEMGSAPFQADRTQADKFLIEAFRVHRETAREEAGP